MGRERKGASGRETKLSSVQCKAEGGRDRQEEIGEWFGSTSDLSARQQAGLRHARRKARGRAEQQLARAHQKIHEILASIQDDFYVLDRDWRFSYVNRQFAQRTGKEPKDFIGKVIWEVFPKHLGTIFEENLRAAMANKEVREFELHGQYTDAWYRMKVYPSPEGISLLGTDITERKRAEEERQRLSDDLAARVGELQTIMDIAPIAIWLAHDPECKAITGNAFADRMIMKVPRGANISRSARPGDAAVSYKTLRHGVEVKPEDLPAQLAARGVTVPDTEYELEFADGRRVHLLMGAVPLRDAAGRVCGSIATGADVTRLKEAEASLREADQRKNDFLAMLSHELRNPLTPVRNSLYILDRAEPGSEQAGRAKAIIDRQVGHMVRLVDDLLDVTRISRGKIHLQRARLDLSDVLRRICEDHRAEFARAEVRLELSLPERPLPVYGDAARISQAVGNLLQNASKFTGQGGVVQVSAQEDPGTGSAVIRVRDNGLGMSPEVLRRIFEPFEQAETSPDRSKGGLGLGLAIVKGMIELHGGSVEAHSEGPGHGAEFVIRLSLHREAATSDSAPNHSPPVLEHLLAPGEPAPMQEG